MNVCTRRHVREVTQNLPTRAPSRQRHRQGHSRVFISTRHCIQRLLDVVFAFVGLYAVVLRVDASLILIAIHCVQQILSQHRHGAQHRTRKPTTHA
jgi:lipopolysaccharide/colanic/teichoic acid biosynthesis glycosyltransferase